MRISNKALTALLALILILAAASWGILYKDRPQTAKVQVTVNGQTYGAYDLRKDQTIRIAPEDGSWYNILRIEQGSAAVIEADCSNQVCVHTPALTEDTIGIIVCLPHGVAVELTE